MSELNASETTLQEWFISVSSLKLGQPLNVMNAVSPVYSDLFSALYGECTLACSFQKEMISPVHLI